MSGIRHFVRASSHWANVSASRQGQNAPRSTCNCCNERRVNEHACDIHGGGRARANTAAARSLRNTKDGGPPHITGRVIAADSGNPLSRATVRLTASALKDQLLLTTDMYGRYEAPSLPAGRYHITVSRLGYVTLEHGQTRPFHAGRELDLVDGQTLERVDFALPRGGVITGRTSPIKMVSHSRASR